MAKIIQLGLATVAAMGLAASVAVAQPSAPVKQLPPGFTVVPSPSQPWLPTAVTMAAVKPNATKPAIAVDADIHFSFAWQPNPGAGRIVEMLAASPEDAASDQGTIKSEPAGRSRLKAGVLTFRKNTVLQVGTSGEPWVTHNGVWVGAVDGGMLSISVMNYAGSKGDIQPWIEALIPAGAAK